MLTPVVASDYSEEDWRVIAGFLLYYRAGILRALTSSNDAAYDATPVAAAGQRRYFRDAESITRWLLSFTPYPVQKNELWDGETYIPRPRIGDPGRPVSGVQDDPPWLWNPAGG
jgi:hypothetical protein